MTTGNNKIKEWLNSPKVKKHMKHFTYDYKHTTYPEIKYGNITMEELTSIIGYVVMETDPYYNGFNQHSIKTALEIYALPPWERKTISELFEYFETECPRNALRKYIRES